MSTTYEPFPFNRIRRKIVNGSFVGLVNELDEIIDFGVGTGPSANGEFALFDILAAQENGQDLIAECKNEEGNPTTDLTPILQAFINARRLTYGANNNRKGGQGVCIVVEAGSYMIGPGAHNYGLELRAGDTLRGVSAKGECRFIQPDDALSPVVTVIGRASNSADVGRRSEVNVSNIQFISSGNLDALGDVIHCFALIPDPEEDPIDDEDGQANRTGVVMWGCSMAGASGSGFNGFKRGKNWMYNSSAGNNGENGIFLQGPDSLMYKCFCGTNGKEQIWVKESATPMLYDLELGPGPFPGQYPCLRLTNNLTNLCQGGNVNGWVLYEGDEDVPTAGGYGVLTRTTFANITFIMKEKSFVDDDAVLNVIDGYIRVQDHRGLVISDCNFSPDSITEVKPGGVGGEQWVRYQYRPENVIRIDGARTRVIIKGKINDLDDSMFPCGAPTTGPVDGSIPTNSYDNISNHNERLMKDFLINGNSNLTRRRLCDSLEFFAGQGITGVQSVIGAFDYPGSAIVGNVIDVDKALNTQSLTGNVTMTFSTGTPTNRREFRVEWTADGTDRTVTLPANCIDPVTFATISSFVVPANKQVDFRFKRRTGTGFYVYGYPSVSAVDAEDIAWTGTGSFAVTTNVRDKLREFPTISDYTTVKTSIDAAIAGDFIVGVLESLTVTVPTQAATLQIACDRLTPLNKQALITINFATGHSPSVGLSISGRDCSQFRITATDAEVNLAAAFAGNVFTGTNGAKLPRLECLIDAATQTSGDGISLTNSEMTVDAGAGVKNAFETGFLLHSNSRGMAQSAIFTGCATSGVGSGITTWGSSCFAEGADVSNSGQYGAQAAHGGYLSFRNGIADDCFRHGIRGTDAAIVDADSASANDCSSDGLGFGVYAYQGSVVNFVNGSVTGNLGTAALYAFGAGSAINAELAIVTGADERGVYARSLGRINVVGATVSGSGEADYVNQGGDIIRDDTPVSGAPSTPDIGTIASGDIEFVPDPTGTTHLRLVTEAAAASDDLDTLTPATGFILRENHVVIVSTSSSGQDVVIRDFATSAAAGNYSFRTPGAASVTLADSSQVAAYIWLGGFWAQMWYSAN